MGGGGGAVFRSLGVSVYVCLGACLCFSCFCLGVGGCTCVRAYMRVCVCEWVSKTHIYWFSATLTQPCAYNIYNTHFFSVKMGLCFRLWGWMRVFQNCAWGLPVSWSCSAWTVASCQLNGYQNLRTVDTALAIAIQRFNKGSTALLDMMLELELVAGTVLEDYATKEDTARVVRATWKTSAKEKERRKRIEAVKRQEQQEGREREGEVYGAGQFWNHPSSIPGKDLSIERLWRHHSDEIQTAMWLQVVKTEFIHCQIYVSFQSQISQNCLLFHTYEFAPSAV